MKKLICPIIAFIVPFFMMTSIAFAAPDNFMGISYTGTYEQYPNLIRGVPVPDGKFSPDQEQEFASRPSFHRGAEKIGNLQVGSIFFDFDKETKLFSGVSCIILFVPDVKNVTVEKVDYTYNKAPYYQAKAPVKQAEKYFDEICAYFEQEYGAPSDKQLSGGLGTAMWNIFDPGICITVSLSNWFTNSKTININITKENYPPEMEIFM